MARNRNPYGPPTTQRRLKGNLLAGVIGLGVGERHVVGYDRHPQCQVKVLCDLNPEVLNKVGERHKGKELTSDPASVLEDPNIDVVSIASYDNSHERQVVQALQKGKHVFVEKPLCLTSRELENIVRTLNAYPSLKLSSNLILRKSPRFMELKNRIESGDFGEIYHFEGSYDYGRLRKLTHGWRGKTPNYSVTHGGGIHVIDLVVWLSGKKVATVQGAGNKIPTKGSIFEGPSLTSAILQFEDGSTAQITSNYASVTPHHHKISVYGTRCTFEQSHQGAVYIKSREPEVAPELVSSPYPGADKSDLLHNFIDSILGETEPQVSKQEVVEAMSISLAIDEAINSTVSKKFKYPRLQ